MPLLLYLWNEMKKQEVKIFHSYEELEADEIKTNLSSFDPEAAQKSYQIFHAVALTLRRSILKQDRISKAR
jgi:hypothetical protein